MAVYERSYRGYAGPLTSPRARFLVIPRYAAADVFASRLVTAFFVLCFVPFLIASIRIYLAHNLEAIAAFGIRQSDLEALLGIDAGVFLRWVVIPQSFLAFLLALAVAPALVSPDLRNNGMALYLARPIGRWDYVGGKLAVLVALLSAVTWLPALALFAFQSYLAGLSWLGENALIGVALVVGFGVWILLLSLLGLAVSATVKWRPVARLLFLALPFVLEAFAGVLNVTFRTEWGDLLRASMLQTLVWRSLLGLPRIGSSPLPVWSAWAMFALVAALCLLVLRRKIRAYEVER